MGAEGGCAPAPLGGFPPELCPGAPSAGADQPQARSACQGPSANADCAPAGAGIDCELYHAPLRHRAQSSAAQEALPTPEAAKPANAGSVPTGLGFPPADAGCAPVGLASRALILWLKMYNCWSME
eukprot:3300971-Alexandrium_andersonii.AAC.1